MESLARTIDRSADHAPEAVAFSAPGERLTYAELVERSNRLAHLLVSLGVRRGDRVGIFMPRNLEVAVAVYGILRAGAVFVPIDPQLPPGALAQLIADCGIEVTIADRAGLPRLRRLDDRSTTLAHVVGPDADLGTIRTHPWPAVGEFAGVSAPDLRLGGDDLAYIMYSSGSTGRPKGIVHTHGSGLAYAELSVATYDVGPDDRIGNHSPLYFDMSTFGYFSGPLAGATTSIVPEAYTKVAASLSQLIESERLTIWYSVPLALIQLLTRGALEQRDLGALRWVLFGGEPFPRRHLDALRALWPQARFSNVYGPAEVNQCTYHHLPALEADATTDADAAPVPIGRVWERTEGLLLTEGGALALDERPGQVLEGELLIRSPTMMQGYWGRRDLDAAVFYRRPAADGAEHTFYRTGDLVRRLENGELLFLGRMDRQVKVRGYRIELDEVERTLAAHSRVELAAVYPVRVGEAIERLEAAVTVQPAVNEAALAGEDLRSYLGDIVSWYAVPARIDILESLPRTGSDKIDRRRLQEAAERAAAEAARVADDRVGS